MAGEDKIRIGISTCLLGEPVRFDGGHKLDRFIVQTLGQYFEFVPVCPEVEAGFGVPRESLRLVGDPERPRLVTTRSGRDLTEPMESWARQRVEQLAAEDLCGFIFKAKSPSSGMERVKVYPERGGAAEKTGSGIFARFFRERFPLLPVEEEGRLNDPKLRESFIEAVFALKRWRDLLPGGRTRGRLVEFHTRHKLLLRARSLPDHNELGRLVARAKELPEEELFASYQTVLLRALQKRSTVAKNTDVLMHMVGYFRKDLSAAEKQELLELIERYRTGLVPLVVPVTILNHYVRKYRVEYLAQQYYLNPHPIELKLRNHV
jgi:uncharacterized protein YbgA (DUF1722 family)/uncharacterized protein YbbK (DUF523 family)